jgi:hypothetical protein
MPRWHRNELRFKSLGLTQATDFHLLQVLFSPNAAKTEPAKEEQYHAAGILSLSKGRLQPLLPKS